MILVRTRFTQLTHAATGAGETGEVTKCIMHLVWLQLVLAASFSTVSGQTQPGCYTVITWLYDCGYLCDNGTNSPCDTCNSGALGGCTGTCCGPDQSSSVNVSQASDWLNNVTCDYNTQYRSVDSPVQWEGGGWGDTNWLPTPTCTPVSPCGSGFFEIAPPTRTSDRVCAQLTSCSIPFVEYTPPTATTDRTCGAVPYGFWAWLQISGSTDTTFVSSVQVGVEHSTSESNSSRWSSTAASIVATNFRVGAEASGSVYGPGYQASASGSTEYTRSTTDTTSESTILSSDYTSSMSRSTITRQEVTFRGTGAHWQFQIEFFELGSQINITTTVRTNFYQSTPDRNSPPCCLPNLFVDRTHTEYPACLPIVDRSTNTVIGPSAILCPGRNTTTMAPTPRVVTTAGLAMATTEITVTSSTSPTHRSTETPAIIITPSTPPTHGVSTTTIVPAESNTRNGGDVRHSSVTIFLVVAGVVITLLSVVIILLVRRTQHQRTILRNDAVYMNSSFTGAVFPHTSDSDMNGAIEI
jgi:hypothetical protein